MYRKVTEGEVHIVDTLYEYGYLLGKVEQNSFRADGKYSQITMVLPEKNAVVYKICFLLCLYFRIKS